MDAHEVVRQSLLYLLHRQQGNDRLLLTLDPNLQILAHPFDVADVGDADLDDTVVGLEEDCIGRRWEDGGR